jgi:hypothetical protein
VIQIILGAEETKILDVAGLSFAEMIPKPTGYGRRELGIDPDRRRGGGGGHPQAANVG